jgi:hypothetical protein
MAMKTIALAFLIALVTTLALIGFIGTLFDIVNLRDKKDKYKDE